MPTPSAPDPPPPHTFSICPDPDDSSASRHDTHRDLPADDGHPIHHSAEANPTINSSSSDGGGGAVQDSEAEASSPMTDSRPYLVDPHKPTDTEGDSPLPPCDSSVSPVEPARTTLSSSALRPRQGVGTGHMSASHQTDSDTVAEVPGSQYPHTEYGMEQEYALPSMGSCFPSKRLIPNSPSSFLRAGSRFTGTQQSERQVYDVQVEIKYVDLRESYLCGYLRIQGLTDDHPTLTTYFEGEIIGSKYGFLTKHPSWGANDKTDLSHWSKFPAFRPYAKQARRGSSVLIKDVAQSEHIFMRWKEHFLVPDHRVRTITGASFEGFYYICFNQVQGEVNGIYFHSKSERFQQLELKHVEDRGCFSALEFR